MKEKVDKHREKIKQNPHLFSKYKENERLRSERRRLNGKLKKLSQLNPAQQIEAPKRNKEYKRKERLKKRLDPVVDVMQTNRRKTSQRGKLILQLENKLIDQKKIANRWKKNFIKSITKKK